MLNGFEDMPRVSPDVPLLNMPLNVRGHKRGGRNSLSSIRGLHEC